MNNLVGLVIEERRKLALESKKGKLQNAYFELQPFSEVELLNGSTLEVAFEGGLVVFKLASKPNFNRDFPFSPANKIGYLDYDEGTHTYMFNASPCFNLDDVKRAVAKFLAQY